MSTSCIPWHFPVAGIYGSTWPKCNAPSKWLCFAVPEKLRPKIVFILSSPETEKAKPFDMHELLEHKSNLLLVQVAHVGRWPQGPQSEPWVLIMALDVKAMRPEA